MNKNFELTDEFLTETVFTGCHIFIPIISGNVENGLVQISKHNYDKLLQYGLLIPKTPNFYMSKDMEFIENKKCVFKYTDETQLAKYIKPYQITIDKTNNPVYDVYWGRAHTGSTQHILNSDYDLWTKN